MPQVQIYFNSDFFKTGNNSNGNNSIIDNNKRRLYVGSDGPGLSKVRFRVLNFALSNGLNAS